MSGLTVVFYVEKTVFYVEKTSAVEKLGGAENKMGRPLLISDRQRMHYYDSGPGIPGQIRRVCVETKSARLVERNAGVFMYSLA